MKFIIRAFVFLTLVSGAKVHAGELKSSLFQFDTDHADQQLISLGFDYNLDHSYETLIGTVKPLLGMFMSENYAAMLYVGAKIDYKIGRMIITPSFSPGLYSKGSDQNRRSNDSRAKKDLGHILEFKSQIDLGFDIGSFGVLSLGLSHISNADIAEKNPGVNNYHFNLSKIF